MYAWIENDYTKEELLAKEWYLKITQDYETTVFICTMLLESKESHKLSMERYTPKLREFNKWKRDHKDEIDDYVTAKKKHDLTIAENKRLKELQKAENDLALTQRKIAALESEMK